MCVADERENAQCGSWICTSWRNNQYRFLEYGESCMLCCGRSSVVSCYVWKWITMWLIKSSCDTSVYNLVFLNNKIKMSTDKIKVAVRVRPFNRRGIVILFYCNAEKISINNLDTKPPNIQYAFKLFFGACNIQFDSFSCLFWNVFVTFFHAIM